MGYRSTHQAIRDRKAKGNFPLQVIRESSANSLYLSLLVNNAVVDEDGNVGSSERCYKSFASQLAILDIIQVVLGLDATGQL